jgi:Ni/Co efflux regulator RcnB
MKTISTQPKVSIAAVVLLLSASLISAPVFADKPSWAGADQGKSEHHGNGKGHGKRDKEERGRDDRDGRDDRSDRYDRNDGNERLVSRSYFTTQQRTVFVDYYSNEFREKGCPPGLAKKKNGCLPPGQAKKWKRGQALPRTVIYEEVPQRVITVIGAPPTGHKFVRVANDILLIAIGTGMIIDAIEDLNR